NVLQECDKLWSSLTAEEKKSLGLHANDQSLPDESPEAQRQLQLKGLLLDGDELFSPVFKEYIRTQAQPWEEALYLEKATGRLWVGGKPIAQLEPTPVELLAELLANANDLVTHDELEASGWGPRHREMDITPQMIHAAISRVRRAIKAVDDPELKVEAIRGKGYYLHVPDTYDLSNTAG
ncbi:MAG: winged helix-turn-helix domain-containing protein, partial [Chloroflexota bacterium]